MELLGSKHYTTYLDWPLGPYTIIRGHSGPSGRLFGAARDLPYHDPLGTVEGPWSLSVGVAPIDVTSWPLRELFRLRRANQVHATILGRSGDL